VKSIAGATSLRANIADGRYLSDPRGALFFLFPIHLTANEEFPELEKNHGSAR